MTPNTDQITGLFAGNIKGTVWKLWEKEIRKMGSVLFIYFFADGNNVFWESKKGLSFYSS